MSIFTDATIIIAITNFINNVVNIYWSAKLRSVQNGAEYTKELKDAAEERDVIIRDLKHKNEQYKNQYNSLLVKYKHLDGQLTAHKEMLNSKPITV